MHRLRVGVLMGGKSIEREVSLNSGRTVCDHLDMRRYRAVPLFQAASGELYFLPWRFLHRGKIHDFEARLPFQAERVTWNELAQHVDFMYIALHGRYGEDGCVQGIMNVLKIPYFGSGVCASALGMDKERQRVILRHHGIQVPSAGIVRPGERSAVCADNDALRDWLDQNGISLPCVVKPIHEGSSLGVQLVTSLQEARSAIAAAATISPGHDQAVIVESRVTGMEFSCICIEDEATHKLRALPPTEIVVEDGTTIFDYTQKYMPGRAFKYTPPRCSDKARDAIQAAAVATAEALGFTTLARIDGFLQDDGTVVIVDPNSFSGLQPSSYAFLQAAEIGMGHTDFINHVITTQLDRYGMKDVMESWQGGECDTTKEHAPRLRVAVFLGGSSDEREISLESGRNVVYKLSPYQYAVTPIFMAPDHTLYALPQRLLVKNTTAEILNDVTPDMAISWDDIPQLCDFAFLALHGAPGEDGSIQGMLDMLGVPYNGSGVFANALCMDKYKANTYLAACGHHVPRSVFGELARWCDEGVPDLPFGFPCIVKPPRDGCSVFVETVHSAEELRDTLVAMRAAGKTHALIEECVFGVELTVAVVGCDKPRALPPSHAYAREGVLSMAEKFLPGEGENQTPADISQAAQAMVQREAERVFADVGCCGYARVDCFYQDASVSPTGEPRVVIIEINTLPALTPATCLFHQASEVGLQPMTFIDMIVQLGLYAHGRNATFTHEQRRVCEVTCDACESKADVAAEDMSGPCSSPHHGTVV